LDIFEIRASCLFQKTYRLFRKFPPWPAHGAGEEEVEVASFLVCLDTII